MPGRPVHPLVIALAAGLNAPAVSGMNIPAGSAGALAHASNLPETVMFAGFLGEVVPQPGGTTSSYGTPLRNWQVLYLNLELTDWLLVEDEGILAQDSITDDAVPFNQKRDVIWVRADASVGRGSGSQSVESQFLTGAFTRAADFDSPPTGGTFGATTGVFCEARTLSCCHRKSS